MKAVVISKFPKASKSSIEPFYLIHNVSLSQPIYVRYVYTLKADTLLERILDILEVGEDIRGICFDEIGEIIRSAYSQGINFYGQSKSRTTGRCLLIYVKGGLIRFLPASFNRCTDYKVLFRPFLEVLIVFDSPNVVLEKALSVALLKFDEF